MTFAPQEIWSTIRRARLIRVLIIYLGASFAALEAVSLVTDQVGLPDWVVPFAFVLLVIGLPIIIATAVAQSASAEATATPASLGLQPESWSASVELQPATPEVSVMARRWLTWHRAILGGVVAFALWGVVVTGYMVARALGIGPVGSLVAAGVLDERDRIILADFENHTPDSLLAGAVSEALRIDLAQSPIVTVVEPAYVSDVLARMERESDARIDLELAREVALREGIKAVIAGEINAAGSGYVLSARLVSAETAESFAAFRETAKNPDAVIAAIDQLSRRLRERIGESLRTIRGNEPLQAVTTSSLEALRRYSQAVRALELEGDDDKGIALLEEAVELDTAFAMAWRKLSVALSNQGVQRAREVEALTRAFEHRDRLTERERYLTIATYHNSVSGEIDKSITAYRALLDIYPDEPTALNNLSVQLWLSGDYAGAEEMARRVLALDSSAVFHWTNLAVALVGQGRIDEAAEVIDAMDRKLPGNPWGHLFAAAVAYARGNYDESETRLRSVLEGYGQAFRATTAWWLEQLAATRGQLRAAEGYAREAMTSYRERGMAGEYLSALADLAYRKADWLGQREASLKLVEDALAQYPLDSLAPLDRPYLSLAWFYAAAAMPERGEAMLAAYERIDPTLRGTEGGELDAARGAVELAAGDYEAAIRSLERWEATSKFCASCPLPNLARAYELAGQTDSALAIYERYLTTPSTSRMVADSYNLGPTYERLGALYEERGDFEKATYYYGKLVELWADADTELQPRVAAARRAIAALSKDR